MPLVQVQDLCLSFSDKNGFNRVLDNISFEVKEGEIISLLGLSGAGKTSLLRTLNLLQIPDSGTIEIKERDITKLTLNQIRNLRKRIGVVFQHFNLFKNKNVFENIAFPLRLQKLEKKEVRKAVEDIANEMNIQDKLKSYPSNLSGGEKQRVALARAMIVNPDLLLLDEPSSALDPKTKVRILDTVNNLNKVHNMTIIVVTHDMDVVKSLSDRVAYLKKGKLIFIGEPQEFFSTMGKEISRDFEGNEYYHTNSDGIQKKDKGRQSNKMNPKRAFIYFWGEKAEEPVLWELSSRHNVEINIISGNIEKLKHGTYGHLECDITGENTHIFLNKLEKEVYKVDVMDNV